MNKITELLTRANKLSAHMGQSISTISRKLLNDGKGLSRLQNGSQCRLKTLERAFAILQTLEQAAGLNE